MSTRFPKAMGLTVLAAAFSGAGEPVVAQSAAGVTFTVSTSTLLPQMIQGMVGEPMYLRGKGQSGGGRTRIELTDADNTGDLLKVGDLLLAGGAGPATIVRPSDKTLQSLLVNLQDPVGKLTGNATSFEVTPDTALVERVGKAEAIEGRTTEKYKITAGYALTMEHPVSATIVVELWTTAVDGAGPNPLLMFGAPGSGPTAPLQRRLAQAMRQIPGLVLKAVVTTSIVAGPEPLVTVQTTLLTDVKAAPVDRAALEVPAGFSRRP